MAAKLLKESDLADYLRVTIPGGKATKILNLANGIVSDLLGLDDTAKLADVPYEVQSILYELAARPYRNPTGATSRTKSIDDWTTTERWEAASATGVRLTADERAVIQSYRDTGEDTTATRRSIPMHVPGYTGYVR